MATSSSSASSPHHHRFGDAEMEAAAAELVPPLTGSRRKGQAGRVAVIGGCREYTGAPFFAAMAALRTGADLAHVFCTPGAAPVIKAYSPDLIVHPLLRESGSISGSIEADGGEEERAAATPGGAAATTTAAAAAAAATTCSRLAALSASDIEPWLPRFDALVVGPGLGSDPAVEEAAALLMRSARKLGLALLVDADALKLVARSPGLVRGYSRAVLTPNAVEFERMAASLGLVGGKGGEKEGESGSGSGRSRGGDGNGNGGGGAPPLRFDAAAFAAGPLSSSPDSPLDAVAALALSLEGPVVVRKGAGDCMAVSVPSSGTAAAPAAAAAAAAMGTTSAGPGAGAASPSPPPVVVLSACCSRQGSPRRAGGQGDLTSGSVAAFLAWACSRRLLASGGGEGEGEREEEERGRTEDKGAAAAAALSPPAALAAAFGGCSLVRGAAAAAFSRRRRAALASDVLDAIEGAGEGAATAPRGFDV